MNKWNIMMTDDLHVPVTCTYFYYYYYSWNRHVPRRCNVADPSVETRSTGAGRGVLQTFRAWEPRSTHTFVARDTVHTVGVVGTRHVRTRLNTKIRKSERLLLVQYKLNKRRQLRLLSISVWHSWLLFWSNFNVPMHACHIVLIIVSNMDFGLFWDDITALHWDTDLRQIRVEL